MKKFYLVVEKYRYLTNHSVYWQKVIQVEMLFKVLPEINSSITENDCNALIKDGILNLEQSYGGYTYTAEEIVVLQYIANDNNNGK